MKKPLCIIFISAFCLLQTQASPAKKSNVKKETKFKGNCNFDDGRLCPHWMNFKEDEFDWKLHQKRTPSSSTGPDTDKSSNDQGYYLYIETSAPRKLGDKAKLISKPMEGVYCLNFYYHMYGKTIGTLEVSSSEADSRGAHHRVFIKSGNQGKRWIGANMTVYGLNYRIIISATVGKSYTGDIAIDDIQFLPGSCDGRVIDLEKLAAQQKAQVEKMCRFDVGICGWRQDSFEDNFDWTLASSSKKRRTGPKADHSGNVMGRYLYMNSDRRAGSKARIISGKVCGEHCLRFSYHMLGKSVGDLVFYKQIGDIRDIVWKRSRNQGDTWNDALVELHDAGCYKIVAEGVVGKGRYGEGDIALDDMWLKPGNCCPLWSTSYKNQEAGNCSFNQDFCKWTNLGDDNFDWIIGTGKSKSSLTGPSGDSTGKPGKYAFIEASEPRVPGDKAVLRSDQLRGSLCLNFNYHMYGEDVGALEIHQINNGLPKVLLWKQEGNFGNMWHQGFVNTTCNSNTEGYKIEITATVGGWRGDIAIDDIYFTSTKCPSNIVPAKITNTKRILPQSFKGYCAFETFCGWVNRDKQDYLWRLHKGATPSAQTGPRTDYDNNSHFAYLEASDAAPNSTAELISGRIYGNSCLTFYYHMFGEGIGQLIVKQIGVQGNETVLWSKTGSQSTYWEMASVTLIGREYKVAFVGIRGKDHRGDIAIDAVSIRNRECSSAQLSGWSPPNGKNQQLKNCDFEEDFCTWENPNFNIKKDTNPEKSLEIKDDFDWIRHKGDTFSYGTGPSSDHTTRKKEGHYLYIETSAPRQAGDRAILAMHGKSATKREMCMHFYYHMKGTNIGKLIIEQETRGNIHSTSNEPFTMTLWEKIGEQSPRDWLKAEVNFKTFSDYSLFIVGVRGNGYQGDIAIDDITFTDGRCYSRK